jgi:hypothetical protein
MNDRISGHTAPVQTRTGEIRMRTVGGALAPLRFSVGREHGARCRQPERPDGCFAISAPDPRFQQTIQPRSSCSTTRSCSVLSRAVTRPDGHLRNSHLAESRTSAAAAAVELRDSWVIHRASPHAVCRRGSLHHRKRGQVDAGLPGLPAGRQEVLTSSAYPMQLLRPHFGRRSWL